MLVTVQDLKDWFGVSEIKDSRLDFCIAAANRTLRSWVSDALYNDTTNETRTADLTAAEANLAMYHLLLNTGARIRPGGVAKKEQDSGGSVTNSVVNEYLSPEELQELRAEYFAAAENAAAKYRPTATTANKPKSGTLTLAGGWRRGVYDDFYGGE